MQNDTFRVWGQWVAEAPTLLLLLVARAGGDAPRAAGLCNSCFGRGKGAVQLRAAPEHPAKGSRHCHTWQQPSPSAELPSHSSVSTGDFHTHFRAAPLPDVLNVAVE